MPLTGITELLSDPDLADTFSVIRRTETVDDHGTVQLTQVQTDGVLGVVSPASGTLERQEDFQSLTKMISVVTTFRLQGPSQGLQPDIVAWGGSQFIVTTLRDFTHWGAGHVEADCVSMTFLDPPPGTGT